MTSLVIIEGFPAQHCLGVRSCVLALACFGFLNQVQPESLNVVMNLLIVQRIHVAARKNNHVQPEEQILIQSKRSPEQTLDSIPLHGFWQVFFADYQAQPALFQLVFPCQNQQVAIGNFELRPVENRFELPGFRQS